MSLREPPRGGSSWQETEAWSLRLYERAKRDQWALGAAVDPALLRLDELPRAVHGAVQRIYTEIRWGEVLALTMTARLVDASPSLGVKMFCATQVMDEARHVEFFTRLVASLGDLQAPGPAMAAFAEELRRVDDIDEILLASQVILEGYAKCLFVEGARAGEAVAARRIRLPGATDPRPLLGAISRYIGGDESRHVAFGVLFLRDRLRATTATDRRRLEDSARAWQAAMDRVLRETEPCLARVGIAPADLRQRVDRTQRAHFRHMGFDT